MEHLSQALRQSVSQNKEMQECLLGTIDKMADGLIAENRQARSSIGKSCTGISVCDDNQREFVKADAFTKDLLAKTKDSKITDEKNSSLDLQNWTCLRVHVKFHSKTKEIGRASCRERVSS